MRAHISPSVDAIKRYTFSVMPAWALQFAILGLVAVAVAQWLDWQSGIEEKQFDRHFGRRRA